MEPPKFSTPLLITLHFAPYLRTPPKKTIPLRSRYNNSQLIQHRHAYCNVVYHITSLNPFLYPIRSNGVKDSALKGTQNLLNSINEVESVKRVVLRVIH